VRRWHSHYAWPHPSETASASSLLHPLPLLSSLRSPWFVALWQPLPLPPSCPSASFHSQPPLCWTLHTLLLPHMSISGRLRPLLWHLPLAIQWSLTTKSTASAPAPRQPQFPRARPFGPEGPSRPPDSMTRQQRHQHQQGPESRLLALHRPWTTHPSSCLPPPRHAPCLSAGLPLPCHLAWIDDPKRALLEHRPSPRRYLQSTPHPPLAQPAFLASCPCPCRTFSFPPSALRHAQKQQQRKQPPRLCHATMLECLQAPAAGAVVCLGVGGRK
jgi:hypothetical protein